MRNKKNADGGEPSAGNAGTSLGGSSPHFTTNGTHDQNYNNIADAAAQLAAVGLRTHDQLEAEQALSEPNAMHLVTSDLGRRRQMEKTAQWYARHGWYVFPVHTPIFNEADECVGCTCEAWHRANGDPDYVCKNPGKCPRVRWSERSTIDEAQIRKWWGQPWAWDGYLPNIGIDCGKSGILSLDVDAYKEHAGDLSDFLTIAEQSTITVVSGGGGQHLLYDAQGKPYGNQTGDLPAGIDVRGVGGYIVAAPSLHKSGRCYSYEEGWGPRDVALLPIPPALDTILAAAHRDAVTSSPATFTATSTTAPTLDAWQLSQRITETINQPAPKGQRSEADMAVCVALAYAGATDDEILSVFEHYPIGIEGKFAEVGRGYLAHTIGKARAFVADNPRPSELIERFRLFILHKHLGDYVPDDQKKQTRYGLQYNNRKRDVGRIGSVLTIMETAGRVDNVLINAYAVVRGRNSDGIPVQNESHKTIGPFFERMSFFFDTQPGPKPNTWIVSLTAAAKVEISTFPLSDHIDDLNIGEGGKVLISTFEDHRNDDVFGSGTSIMVRDRLRNEAIAEAGEDADPDEVKALYHTKLDTYLRGLSVLAIPMIDRLLAAGEAGLSTDEICEAFDLTKSATGGLLRNLRATGLITSQRRYKQSSLHSIAPDAWEWLQRNSHRFRTAGAGVVRLDKALLQVQARAEGNERSANPDVATKARRSLAKTKAKRRQTVGAIYPDAPAAAVNVLIDDCNIYQSWAGTPFAVDRNCRRQQPVAANGRTIIPANVHDGKNGQTKREQLDILLQKEYLFADESDAAQRLAYDLGVTLTTRVTPLWSDA